MKPTAQHNKVNISPRKARLVTHLIRGLPLPRALAILRHTPHKASPLVYKLLLNAANNWQQAKKQATTSQENLYIKNIWVHSGRMLKRIQPAPQGRAHRIRKRSAHINVLLEPITPKSQLPAPDKIPPTQSQQP